VSTWVARLDSDGDGDGPRLAVKDCIDVAGMPTTAGCPVVAEMAEPAPADAAVVATARAAGARIAGKTTLTELCWSASGINQWAGTPVNPRDPRRLPGGSSSGSAVAVASGQADIAYGTDTGGSVRIPAACCGVAGLKTRWGRIPLKGVYPLAPSLDTVGPLGRDVAAVEAGMALLEPGFAAPGAAERGAGRITVSGPPGGVDPRVDAAVDRALTVAGVAVSPAASWDFRPAVDAAGVIIDYEGFKSNAYLMPYISQLSPHVQRNLERGARLRPADIAAARRLADEVRAELETLLRDHPVLVMPTLTGQPPLVGEHGIPLTLLTAPVNLSGLPALALPVPPADPGEGDLIASLQVIGESEEQVLAFGRLIEAALAAGLPWWDGRVGWRRGVAGVAAQVLAWTAGG
jgi:amidase